MIEYTAGRFSPGRAEALATRIDRAVRPIADAPDAGSLVPEFHRINLRERFVRPLRIIYVVDVRWTSIAAVIHHGRALTSMVDSGELESQE